jgi:hypothetical protein
LYDFHGGAETTLAPPALTSSVGIVDVLLWSLSDAKLRQQACGKGQEPDEDMYPSFPRASRALSVDQDINRTVDRRGDSKV